MIILSQSRRKRKKQNQIELIAFFFSLSFTALLPLSPLEDNNQLFIYVKIENSAVRGAKNSDRDLRLWISIYLSIADKPLLSTEIESDAEHSKIQNMPDVRQWYHTFMAAMNDPVSFVILFICLLNECGLNFVGR